MKSQESIEYMYVWHIPIPLLDHSGVEPFDSVRRQAVWVKGKSKIKKIHIY